MSSWHAVVCLADNRHFIIACWIEADDVLNGIRVTVGTAALSPFPSYEGILLRQPRGFGQGQKLQGQSLNKFCYSIIVPMMDSGVGLGPNKMMKPITTWHSMSHNYRSKNMQGTTFRLPSWEMMTGSLYIIASILLSEGFQLTPVVFMRTHSCISHLVISLGVIRAMQNVGRS